MKKLSLFLVFTFISFGVHSESYSPPVTVEGITLGSDYARLKFSEMSSLEDCDNQGWYVLDTSTTYGEQSLSIFMAAKVSSSKVSVQLHECISRGAKSYPKINHVYFCDTQFCS